MHASLQGTTELFRKMGRAVIEQGYLEAKRSGELVPVAMIGSLDVSILALMCRWRDYESEAVVGIYATLAAEMNTESNGATELSEWDAFQAMLLIFLLQVIAERPTLAVQLLQANPVHDDWKGELGYGQFVPTLLDKWVRGTGDRAVFDAYLHPRTRFIFQIMATSAKSRRNVIRWATESVKRSHIGRDWAQEAEDLVLTVLLQDGNVRQWLYVCRDIRFLGWLREVFGEMAARRFVEENERTKAIHWEQLISHRD